MIPSVTLIKHKILGHTQAFAQDTLGFVLPCAKAGLTMAKARIAFRDFVISLDPEAIHHVLHKNHRNYKKPARPMVLLASFLFKYLLISNKHTTHMLSTIRIAG